MEVIIVGQPNFTLDQVLYLFKVMSVLWFYSFLLLVQTVKYNSVALLLGYNKVFFYPKVLDFHPIYFPHILSISGKPHLFSWERYDSSIEVCTS